MRISTIGFYLVAAGFAIKIAAIPNHPMHDTNNTPPLQPAIITTIPQNIPTHKPIQPLEPSATFPPSDGKVHIIV